MSSGILQTARPLKLDHAFVGAASYEACTSISRGGRQEPPFRHSAADLTGAASKRPLCFLVVRVRSFPDRKHWGFLWGT